VAKTGLEISGGHLGPKTSFSGKEDRKSTNMAGERGGPNSKNASDEGKGSLEGKKKEDARGDYASVSPNA